MENYEMDCADSHYLIDSLRAQAYNLRIMNRLTADKRARIINALVEGNSLRAASRLAGVAFSTVLKLLPEIGKACEDYQRRVLVNLPCKRFSAMKSGRSAMRRKRTYRSGFVG
jgi:hypothetical protein